MKYLFTLLVIASLSSNLYAQSVNDYKYVIVPEKYDFLKYDDEYQVNSLTKFLFNKYGFEAYLEKDEEIGSLPIQKCDALYVDVVSTSTFVRAKLSIVLKDCNDIVIFKSKVGSSKDKDYKKAYHSALRNAFPSIEALQYSYNPTSSSLRTINNDELPKTIKSERSVELNSDDSISFVNAITYWSQDHFYKAERVGERLFFYDNNDLLIGSAEISESDSFNVVTTDFVGTAFFLEDELVITRKIKGISGLVKMIFNKKL